MTVVVTGCAGFIGGHIVEACLAAGQTVLGVDLMTDYYDVDQKRSNLAAFVDHDRFELRQVDLARGCEEQLEGADVVYHQAGQPGVRASWRDQFDEYLSHNVKSTQRLLDAAVRVGVPRVVYAVVVVIGVRQRGAVSGRRVGASAAVQPIWSHQLAAEHLCSLYASNFGLSTVSLRYFTVYGPRQRPDMATHRLFEAAIDGTAFPLFGTGDQLRDFTYVGDVVRANLLASGADVEPGLVVNVAGGGECSMHELIAMVEEIAGAPIELDRRDPQRGDVGRTGAITDVARDRLGWLPEVGLRAGLERQYEWHLSRRR